MKLEAVTSAAERVRQDDVRAGLDEGALELRNALRMIYVPELRRIARLQAAIEQIAAGRSVGQQPGTRRKKRCQTVGHAYESTRTDAGERWSAGDRGQWK